MVEIIAEIGWNHMGNMSLAEEMIAAAAESGADYAKFQTWDVNRLKPGPWDTDGRRQIYEKAMLTAEDHYTVSNACKRHKIKFLSSCFCYDDMYKIRNVSKEIKIPSHESRNVSLITSALAQFDRVFVSCGAMTHDEFRHLLEIIKILVPVESVWKRICLMHCVSAYPCASGDIHIARMNRMNDCMKQMYVANIYPSKPMLGYSGHHETIWDAVMAVANGADVVEKHFTIDRNLPGRDNAMAILPGNLKILRQFCDEQEGMLGNPDIEYRECEKDIRENYAGRWNG